LVASPQRNVAGEDDGGDHAEAGCDQTGLTRDAERVPQIHVALLTAWTPDVRQGSAATRRRLESRMPSVGHIAVGLAAARVRRPPAGTQTGAWAALLVVSSCLPDLDVIAFRLGIPYHAPFGHRGAVHSLAFAVSCGIALAAALRAMRRPALTLAVA